MLDKSLPYANIIMKRKADTPIQDPFLTQGFSFVLFNEGDEKHWADIVTSVGEFDTFEEALNYFRYNFLGNPMELCRRLLFIQSSDGEKVGTLTIWWNYTGEKRDLSIHWVAVKPSYQGLGLGKALVNEGLRRMIRIEGDRDVYLHTQTWSYKAMNIYLKAGFELQKEEVFGNYKNDYDQAMNILADRGLYNVNNRDKSI